MVENLPVMQETWVQSLGLEGPLEWQPTPVFLPGKSHEQRSLVGYSSWDCKESDITEWLSTAHLWRYEVVNVWVTRKWHMIWTKEWEITGLCHFMWGKIKENCLKNTEKLQVNAEQLQKDCYSMRHFPFVFFIFKLNVWGYVNVPCSCQGEQSWRWTASIWFLNHKTEIPESSLPTLVSITHAIGLSFWEKHAKYNALGVKHRKIFILTALIP